MARLPILLLAPAALIAAHPAQTQQVSSVTVSISLADRLKEGQRMWEALLAQGENATVRKTVEGLLAREGQAVNPANYNDMHALVALRGLAARAAVGEGAWEDGLDHLRKGQTSATENVTNTQALFTKLRSDHEARIKVSEEAIAKQAPRLKELDDAPGLVDTQLRLRQQLRTFVDEHQAAIKHSQQSMKDMDAIQAQLQKDREDFARDAEAWAGFLAKEKEDIASRGGATAYVAEKVAQVKADDARPRTERLAYAFRLQRLDPANHDVERLLNGLLGKDEEPEKPAPKPKRKAKKA